MADLGDTLLSTWIALTRLAGPIELVTALDDSERGRQLAELVQEIVAAGGGKVWIESALDAGTCVHCWLPAVQQQG